MSMMQVQMSHKKKKKKKSHYRYKWVNEKNYKRALENIDYINLSKIYLICYAYVLEILETNIDRNTVNVALVNVVILRMYLARTIYWPALMRGPKMNVHFEIV